MVASVQTIASNDPRLFWSPPLGMGSEAIGIVAHVGNEAEKNRTKNMRKERKDSRTDHIDRHFRRSKRYFKCSLTQL